MRIVDDVVAYLKDQVLCTYVGKMTQQTIFWTRRDSNMPGIEREDVLLRRCVYASVVERRRTAGTRQLDTACARRGV